MTKFATHTGSFPVGFRRGNWKWQNELSDAIAWAKDNGFGVLDLGRNSADVKPVVEAGIRIGSVDLADWQGLISPDRGKRDAAVQRNVEYIAACGAQNYFAVMLPEDPARSRKENFAYMTESLNALAPALEKSSSRLVIEGWPGPGSLVCTPDTFRATFRECPSPAIGINYDPSHLMRMGIDPIRFLKEFVSRVGHVHAKDTAITADDLYEYGTELPSPFRAPFGYGGTAWRYTIPGHGGLNWPHVLSILVSGGYAGAVSIELEDMNYSESDELRQAGLLAAAKYLSIA